MNVRSPVMWVAIAGVAVLAAVVIPAAVRDEGTAPGFDGHIQSGTCAHPTTDLTVDLKSPADTNDVQPYVAIGHDGKPVTLGFYGAPELPGFGVGALYSDEQFSMVITDPHIDNHAVACGDILEPRDHRFAESGVAVVQLLPVGSSTVTGFAALERTSLQRETDITPTRARIILSTEAVKVPAAKVAGYEGYIQSGQCGAPTGDLKVDLKSVDKHDDVRPFEAISPGVADPVTVAYYGSPAAPGFGVAAQYADEHFSVVIADAASGAPLACGDILEPDDDDITEAGLALVHLTPIGGAGVQGYAVLDRLTLQRELDVTPTVVRVFLFAPPATGA